MESDFFQTNDFTSREPSMDEWTKQYENLLSNVKDISIAVRLDLNSLTS